MCLFCRFQPAYSGVSVFDGLVKGTEGWIACHHILCQYIICQHTIWGSLRRNKRVLCGCIHNEFSETQIPCIKLGQSSHKIKLIEKISLIAGWSSCKRVGALRQKLTTALKRAPKLPILMIFGCFANSLALQHRLQHLSELQATFPHLSLPAVCNLAAPHELLWEVYVIKIAFAEEQRGKSGNSVSLGALTWLCLVHWFKHLFPKQRNFYQ